MKILLLIISSVLSLSIFLFGCSTTPQSDFKVKLDEEVSLGIGQSVLIEDVNLHIKFIEVTEDSRCPRNVTCVWEGQAVSSLQITESDESVSDLQLIEPGLKDGFSEVIFSNYKIYFHLNPYPEDPGDISQDEYRLTLAVTSLKAPIDTEADVTGVITNVELIAKKDIIGRISVESPAENFVDKYVITVNRDTGIYFQAGSGLQNVTFDYLEAQQRIKLWIDGPVMESFPMQATAGQIVVIE